MRELDRKILSLSNAIRYARELRGLSARALSLQSGLSESYVGKLESEAMQPSLDAFCSIVRVLGLSDAEILLLIKTRQGEIA